MAESKPVLGEKSKTGKERKVNHLKMIVIDDLRAETIDSVVTQHIDPQATLVSDASTSYVHMEELVEQHCPQVVAKEEVGKFLP